MFYPTVEGTFEEKIASLEINSAHAKPVSFNWDFTKGEGDLKDEENLRITRVIIYVKGKPTQWIAQTSTSGWRGFWVADYAGVESGKTYILWFQPDGAYTEGIKVEFVMPSGKI